ncbi:MAG: M48 family metalloprotease [Candidatus Micrarchaeota archaeon]|nr:M48 family metalloprotease [Candidatus Micrarchaeota archaeon]
MVTAPLSQKTSFFDAIDSNKLKSILLILAMSFIFFILIYLISYILDFGIFGIVLGAFGLVLYAGISYFAGDKIILSISGAKKVEKKDYPYLYNTVEGLVVAAQLPMLQIYVMEDESPNAFATGRDPQHASIAVTTGLLKIMTRQELEGVIAHEISHVGNYDIRFMMVAIVFAGAISLVSNVILRSFLFGGRRDDRRSGGLALIAIIFAILAPIFALLIRLAISRQREYLADANGARMTRYPEGLASALEKIGKVNKPVAVATDATASLYFSNPLKAGFLSFLSTHPPMEERIKRLRGMY